MRLVELEWRLDPGWRSYPRGNGGIVVRRYERAKLANGWQPLQEVMAVRPFEAHARLSHDSFLSISIRVRS
jgi:hypothetical protein